MSRKVLFVSGILSSLHYVAMLVFVPMLWDGYSSASQTVSELSAIDAPTRPLWVTLIVPYSLLLVAFGWGVWKAAAGKRQLRIVGILMIIHGIVGLFWPPMHLREVLAAGGGTLTDTLHIAWTLITIPLMLLEIVFGAAAFGKQFRFFSLATIMILMVFGAMTGFDSPQMEANLPTPWMGAWERISIGAFMLWVVVFAIILLRDGPSYSEEIGSKEIAQRSQVFPAKGRAQSRRERQGV